MEYLKAVEDAKILHKLRLLSQYANLFEFNITTNSGDTTITLVHDMGINGSIFFGEYVRSALGASDPNDDIELDENSVTIQFNTATIASA
jgi:hypothetical protein